MKRNTFGFNYKVSEIIGGIRQQREWREGRLAFWLSEVERLRKDIAEKGLEFSNVGGYGGASDPLSNSYQPRLQMNNSLVQDITQAQSKVVEHDRAVKDYTRWLNIFKREDEHRVMELNEDDVAYFFIVGEDE